MRRLYHYTDLPGLEAILEAREIRPATIRVTTELVPGPVAKWLTVGPIVWLTINPILDGTVLVKLCGGKPENLCRITLPYLCDTGLAEYCDREGVDHEWFRPMVQTGHLAGSDYTTWRLHSDPIPESQWVQVERGGEWLEELRR